MTVRAWSISDVSAWLRESNLSHIVPVFKEHDIQGYALLELDLGIMKEMGIATMGDRLRLQNAIRMLQKQCLRPVRHEPNHGTTDVSADRPPMVKNNTTMPFPARSDVSAERPPMTKTASTVSTPMHGLQLGSVSSPSPSCIPQRTGSPAPRTKGELQTQRRPNTATGLSSSNLRRSPTMQKSPQSARSSRRPATATSANQIGYSVGRGAFAPSGKARLASISAPYDLRRRENETEGTRLASPSLQAIRRHIVKFLAEDGSSRSVDVSPCRTASDVLSRVLHKFGVPNDAVSTTYMQRWAVAMTGSDSQLKVLSESELMTVCSTPHNYDPVWQHGLYLLRTTDADPIHPGSRRAQPEARRDELAPRRASTFSILSGLGVSDEADDSSPTRNVWRVRSFEPPRPGIRRRVRNFFGQRPPSELISSHLSDFFPTTDTRVLQRYSKQLDTFPRPMSAEQPLPRSNGQADDSSSVVTLDDITMDLDQRQVLEGARLYDSSVHAISPKQSSDMRSPNSAPLELQSGKHSPTSFFSAPCRADSRGHTLSDWSQSATPTTPQVLSSTDRISNPGSVNRASMLGTPVAGSASPPLATPPVTDMSDAAVSKFSSPRLGPRSRMRWHKGALIGAGSFGKVYLGMNAKTGLLMAVKQVELPSSEDENTKRRRQMVESLEAEIALLKTIQHPNIVQYLDSYMDDTHLNIFLEYVPGGSVVTLLHNYGAFEEPLVQNFVRQILHGLSFLHERTIVHRDIKGANILVDNKGGVKISDFGISKKVESGLLMAGKRSRLQGTVFWMAPEVVRQTSHTTKADIWSLGCLVVEMYSGIHPWASLDQMQALFQLGMGKAPPVPDDISPLASDFLQCTFERDASLRPSADDLLKHAFITQPVEPNEEDL